MGRKFQIKWNFEGKQNIWIRNFEVITFSNDFLKFIFWDEFFSDIETIPWTSPCCQNCRKISGFLWHHLFEPKIPVPGSVRREMRFQPGFLLEETQEHPWLSWIPFCATHGFSLFSMCLCNPKSKSKGSVLPGLLGKRDETFPEFLDAPGKESSTFSSHGLGLGKDKKGLERFPRDRHFPGVHSQHF